MVSADALTVLRWADQADLEPHAVMQAVRDAGGDVVDFVYREINDIACREQRRQREDLLGRSVVESVPEVKRSGLLIGYARCVNTGQPLVLRDFTYHGKAIAGVGADSATPQPRYYDVLAVPLPDDCLSLRWRDVTDRVEALAAAEQTRDLLRISERHFRLLAENAGDVVAYTGPDGVMRWVSPSVEQSFGAPPQDWVGRDIRELVPEQDLPIAAAALRAADAGATVHQRIRVFDGSGGIHWVEFTAKRFHDGEGHLDGYVSTFRLIDDEVAGEHRLAETASRLRAATDAMLDPQVLIEAVRNSSGHVVDFVYLDVNRAACGYLSMRREELVGSRQLDTLPNLRESGLHGHYVRCLETGEPVVLDDFPYFNEILDPPRRYDIRAARVGADSLVLTWRDVTDRAGQRAAIERDRDLLQAVTDAMFDSQAVVEAIQNPVGDVVDLVCRDVNRAFCEYLGITRAQQVDHSLLATFPGAAGAGLLERFGHCALTGEPVVLDDFPYFNEVLGQARRYDIRATQVRRGLITLTFRDTTERFEDARRLADSEEHHRLLVLNSSDAVLHVREGIAVWVAPAIENLLGAPAEHWVGTEIRDVVPPEDIPAFEQRWAILEAGGEVQQRVRVNSVDGATHWAHLHARPFYDANGRRDGVSAALRRIDDEVAAEQELAEARRRQAAADELYRRSMESAAVGMCLASPEGPLLQVNQAMCEFFGYDADTLLTKTWIELTAPEYRAADLAQVAEMVAGRIESYEMDKQFIHADGRRIWGHLAVGCVRADDGSVEMSIGQIVDITAQVHDREQLELSEQNYRLIAENASDIVIQGRDGRFVWITPSAEELLGAPAAYWIGRELREVLPPEDRPAFAERIAALEAGGTIQRRSRVMAADGAVHWVHLRARPFYDAEGRQGGFISALRVIDAEVAAENAAAEARRQRDRAHALYRRSVDSAAVGMCLIDPTGGFVEVNAAICEFFGYDADTLKQKTWQELTAPDFLAADLSKVDDVLEGRRDSYRMLKQYVHADGHLIWGDLSVGCVRDEQGRVEQFISQITDVTAAVETNAHNVLLNQRLTEDLHSAANYMASIMPRDLSGTVGVSSRYLPSRELGGDCFDYTWLDDDHLMVHLIDVSGHGIEPALLAVSLQNMLRSGAFATETLLDPAAVLGQLNRMFQMEQQGDHFFTIWYGVYERSTRLLRYASAGAPPAYAFITTGEDRVAATALTTSSVPVGVVRDETFAAAGYSVPPGCRVLIFSDGASELPLPDGKHLSMEDFEALVTEVAGAPGWSLDDLLDKLRSLTPDGGFEDDVSLVRLAFD